MKIIKKLLTIMLGVFFVVISTDMNALASSSVNSSITTEPKGDLSNGIITISSTGINWSAWEGDCTSFIVRIRAWDSLALYQANPSGGGTVQRLYGITNKFLNYNFISNHVYRVWITGETDTGKYVPIGGYEWEAS